MYEYARVCSVYNIHVDMVYCKLLKVTQQALLSLLFSDIEMGGKTALIKSYLYSLGFALHTLYACTCSTTDTHMRSHLEGCSSVQQYLVHLYALYYRSKL